MKQDETFLLIDLKDDRSKSIAQTITNDTCRTILRYLTTKNEATESVVAKETNLALSTVHYNLRQLKKAGLVVAKQFVWSDKGKKMPMYQLAKKTIIISPDTTHGFTMKLKSLLPAALVGLIGTAFVYGFTRQSVSEVVGGPIVSESLRIVADNAADSVAFQASSIVAEPSVITQIIGWLLSVVQEPAFYFMLGVVVTLVVLMIAKKRRE